MTNETWKELCLLVNRFGEKEAKELIEAMNKYLKEMSNGTDNRRG